MMQTIIHTTITKDESGYTIRVSTPIDKDDALNIEWKHGTLDLSHYCQVVADLHFTIIRELQKRGKSTL